VREQIAQEEAARAKAEEDASSPTS